MKLEVPGKTFLLKVMPVAAPLVTEREVFSRPQVNEPELGRKSVEKLICFHLGKLKIEGLGDYIVHALIPKQLRFLVRHSDIEGGSSFSKNYGGVWKKAQDNYRQVYVACSLDHSFQQVLVT
jgi:hypothetical protein